MASEQMRASYEFDTAGGTMLEVKKPMSLNGATTRLAAQAQHTGMDVRQNTKVLNELFDKTNEYLNLFKS